MAEVSSIESDAGAATVSGQVMPWVMLGLAAAVLLVFLRGRGHRLTNVPRRPKVFTPEVGVTMFFAMYLLGVIVQTAAGKWLGFDRLPPDQLRSDPEAIVKLQSAFYLGQALVVVAYFRLLARAKPLNHDGRSSILGAVLLGGGALVLLWPIVQTAGNVAGWIMEVLWHRTPDAISHELLNVFVASEKDGWFWGLVVCATLLPGVFEEVLYRGLLQETLRRMRLEGWTAIGLTSVLFSAVHIPSVEPHALAALFVLSLGFGWAYEKTGRLVAPITMHILFNAANLGLAVWTFGGAPGG